MVTSPPGTSARYVHAYHQNNSLLFQFILVEFIEAFEAIQQLDLLCGRRPSPIPTDGSLDKLSEAQRHKIRAILTHLVGCPIEYMRIFSWNFNEGLLAKLKTYCTLFLQNAESGEKELIAMQHYADKVWQCCFQANEALREEPQDNASLLVAIEKASSAMYRLSKVMTRSLHQFRDDENVIFCVLRYKERLDKLYGSRFVVKLLCRLYPKGLREAQAVLSKRYASRGFDNVLSIIANKISELENSLL